MIWKTTLAFLVTIFSLGSSYAQLTSTQFTADKPDLRNCAGWTCNSNNFTLTNVFISLVDSYGTPLTNTTCQIGTVKEAYVLLNYSSNANNTVNNTRFFADLVIDGQVVAINKYIGQVAGNSTNNQIELFGPFEWTCGQELFLQNNLVVWRTGGSATELTSYDCGTYNKSQCEFPVNTIIAAPLAVEFDYTICTNENNVATVNYNSTTSGGIPPYTYKWDFQNDGVIDATTKNPSFSFSQTSITTKLVVTDSQNLSSSYTLSVSKTTPTAAKIIGGQDLSCSNTTTILDGSSSIGNGTISYLWQTTNGIIDSGANTATATVSASGTYTLTVTDSNGCTSTASVTTTLDNTVPTAAIANNNGLALSCNIPNTTLTASGGVSYSWSNGATTAAITVNTADTFTVTVTGANGCTSTASVTTTLDNTAPNAAISNNNGLALSCNVPNTTLTASGGVSYSWSNGATTAAINVNIADTFTVTVTGANGCTSTASVTTTLDNTVPTAAIANNNGLALSCNVPNTTLTASGGVSYSWSNGATTAAITVNTADTFTVTVTGANGCTSTASVTTTLDNTVPTAAIANNNGLALSCNVPNTTLTASGGVSYSWSNGAKTAAITVNTADTFTVTVTGANGCTSTASVTTTLDNTAPTAVIANNNGLALSCNVPNTTLTASGGVSYSWSNGATTAAIIVNTAGTFTVTVTGANGCTSTASVKTTLDNTAPNAAISNNNGLALSCNVPNTTLTASGGVSYSWSNGATTAAITVNIADTFTVTVTGANGCTSTASVTTTLDNTVPNAAISNNNGLALSCNVPNTTLTASGGVSYSWSNGATTAAITVNTADTFTVTVTGANGCPSTASVTTTLDNTVPTAAIANNNGLALSCNVPNTTLTASGGVSYSWSNGATTAAITVNIADTFTVTVTGANGCTSTASVTTTLDNTVPNAAISNNNGLALSCNVPNTTLTASGGVSYSWSNGATTAAITVNTADTFTVTVTGANGCASTASVTTTLDNTVPTAAIANNNGLALSCNVPNTTLTASGGVSYSWSNGATTAAITVNTADTFTVTVTGTNGCASTASVTVEKNITTSNAVITGNEVLTCATTSVTLDASTSTADGEFTYLWSNGSTDSSITVTEPGSYSVTITGANGCADEASVTVEQNITVANAVITGNEVLTCATTSVTLDASTSTADGEFTYLWSDGSTDSSITVTEPGSYSVTITGANGCADEASVTVEQNITVANAVITGNEVLTCETTSVTLDASTSTADGEFTYLWSNGSTDSSITVTEPGSYSVTITGANGCADEASVTVEQNITVANAVITGNEVLTCATTSVTLDASTSTADGEFTYLWSNGSTDSSINVAEPGSYSVTITGANGCADEASVTVEQNITVANAVITGNEVLTCATTSVTLDASTSTADGEFTYLWSNGSTDSSITVTEPGSYSVTITGANGCADEASVTVEQNITVANAVITGNDVLTCATTSVTLDASTSTADGEFTYLWSDGSTDSSITVTEPGSYSVTITGANGCADEASVTVEQNITVANAVITGNEVLTCATTSVTLDASTSTADGEFTYLWSNGSTDSSITVTEPGSYSVTITGANGCADEASVTVEQNITVANAVITGNEVLTCATTSVTLDASTSTADGEFTYLWSNGSTDSSITVTEPGSYSVTITGANGCADEASVTVEQNITVANAVITGNDVLTCATTSVTLDASTSTADGEFTYLWSNGSTDSSITVTEPGSYSVTITGANGCTNTASVTVEQNNTTSNAVITGNEVLTCATTSVTLDASTSTADGEFTYLWSDGSTDSSITVTEPGSYSVTITGANGCADEASVTVEQNITVANAVITGNEVLTCETTSITLDASTSTADGEFTYLWSNGSTDSSITVTEPGSYSVTITGANGCADTASVIVEQNITVANAVITGNEVLTCETTSVTLDASTSTADGEFTYLWSNGSTDSSINVTEPGSYSVTITGANGCADEASVTVEQNITPADAVITGNEVLTCANTSITLDASTSTADGEFTYLWSNGSTDSSITVTEPGDYSVTITGANGCADEASVTVEQNITVANAVITGNEVLTCETTSVTLDASTSTADGEFTYLWSNGSTDSFINVTEPGSYSVTITGANGCADTATVTVEQNNTTSNAVITGNEVLTCATTSVTLDASTSTADGEFTYLWSNGSTDSSITVTEPGDYSVTITGANGCADEASVTVEQNITVANAVITGNEVLTCETTSVTLDASTSTADGEFTYLWSNGSTDSFINVTEPGDYSVTITGANGCADTATVTVEQNNTTSNAVITGNEVLTCATTSVTLDASTSTADGEFTYLWSNGSTDSFINVTEPGSYSVTITGGNGCADEASVTVEQNITVANAVITGNDVLTCATTSVTLDASTSTADGEFTYLWSNGSTESSINVTEPGSYSVTITGANGCADEASVTVEQNITVANAVITGNEVLTCATTSITLDASTSTADGEFTYLWSNGSTDSSITVTEPGSYSVTITGANGCADTASVIVEQNITVANAVITGNEVLTCETTSVTLDASTSAADGEFTYLWSNGSTDSSITVTEPGSYFVTITGANGCADEASVTVEQNNTTSNAVITGNEVLTCATTSITLDASTSTADGEFTYLWSNGSTDSSITVTEPGSYSVTITGANGCADEASVTVEQNITVANAVITGNEVLTCATTSVTLDASTSTADGEFTYLWSNGSTGSSITVTEPGSYSVTITGANGCTSTASVTVEQNITVANAVITGNDVLTCATTSITLDASTSTADGEFTYLWSNGSTGSSITVTEPGSYSVTITGGNGCADTASVTVLEDKLAPAAVTVSVVQPTCTVATGSLSITAVDGLQYSFNGGEYGNSTIFEGLSAGTYTITAKAANGCVSEAISVTINEQPATPAAPALTSTTQPTCTVATGSFSITAVNGLQYSFNGGDFGSATTFNALSAGTYTVIARSAEGCVSAATSVTINAQPATPAAPAVASTTQPTCTVATGSFSITAVNGLEYSFNGGDFGSATTFNSLSAGTYTVIARNSEGCVSAATSVTIVAENGVSTPVISSTVQPDCDTATGSITVTAQEGITYSINGTDFQAEATFEGLNPGSYNVTAKNQSGCISQAAVVVIAEAPSNPEISILPASFCIEDEPETLFNYINGNLDENGTWVDTDNTGALNGSILDPEMLALGNYNFNYITGGDCSQTITIAVSINDDCVVLPCSAEDIKASISKAVTPNGDGFNDFLEISKGVDCDFIYSLKIFNRWGNEVYSNRDYNNNWDGFSNKAVSGSDQLPSGTYYYIIEINSGTIAPIQGYIYLGTK